MPVDAEPGMRMVYIVHSVRSDWNNGNAHFLRGLLRAFVLLGHEVTIFEMEHAWSIENLRLEDLGQGSLARFDRTYAELHVETHAADETATRWRERLRGTDVVVLHEWNPPAMAQMLLTLRDELGFTLLFHDTHHRASSSPEQMERFGLSRFDGVLAFGESLRSIYRERFGIEHVWTLHEAADITVFHPALEETLSEEIDQAPQVVWIGNWGDDERSAEITEFLLKPAAALAHEASFCIFGVRYPQVGLDALQAAGVRYGGYLPNLQAPATYGAAQLTVHIPRQQYSFAMRGIPTIRMFEALACGIPLISAPWEDTEHLFRRGDFSQVVNGGEMIDMMRVLLNDRARAEAQAQQGLATVLDRHTCMHRARELTAICEELRS